MENWIWTYQNGTVASDPVYYGRRISEIMAMGMKI